MSIPTIAREYYLPKVGALQNLTLRETAVPKPKANEVLVKVHAVSLQYRDLMVTEGVCPAKLVDQLVPCSDMAGEVVSIGQDVNDWKQGDRVCANFSTDHLYGDATVKIRNTSMGAQAQGVLTEYRTFPAHSNVSIPEHLSYEEASMLPCATLTAYNSLNGPIPIKAGDTLVVPGTGGVSIAALQIGVAAGATVIATSSSDEELKIATKLGAKHVINYKTTPNWDEKVLEFVFGGPGTLPKSINALRIGGVANIIGFVGGLSQDQNVLVSLIVKAVTLCGIQIGWVKQFNELNRLLSANQKVTKPVIDKVFAFEEALDAYLHLKSQAHVGKVVIKVA